MDVSFGVDRIEFRHYEFVGATVHPNGTLTVAQIRDVDTTATPPEIRTKLGETLFVPRDQQAALREFCQRNNIVDRYRPDVWADLLEPFLDTRFDEAHERATEQRILATGLSHVDIEDIRARLRPLMDAYNLDSMLWEWVELNLYDLLSAASGRLVPAELPATLGDPVEFYAWAMEIADRAHRSG
jgi:hypothetical protein